MNQAASKACGARPEDSPPSRAAFAFIFITVLLDMLALGIIIPVLPTLVVGFMGGDTAGGAEVLGSFGTALMQFLFSPVLGVASSTGSAPGNDVCCQRSSRPDPNATFCPVMTRGGHF